LGFGFFFDPALNGVDLGGEAGLGLGDAAVERGAHEGGGRRHVRPKGSGRFLRQAEGVRPIFVAGFNRQSE
jgi:hypothetical protein